MDTQIIAIFCLCDDMLKALHHPEDKQCQMSDAEVMTTALVAALHFRGTFEAARKLLRTQGYIPRMLSKSRFNRRLHRLNELFLTLFHGLGEYWKALNAESRYLIDSFPISACDPCRIARSRRYRGEVWRGYLASKRRYFYGLKIHLLVTAQGQPVEFFLTPGSYSDTRALRAYAFDLPQGAQVIGDRAYNNYELEEALALAGLRLTPLRRRNSRRAVPPWEAYLRQLYRRTIETTGSLLERLLPKSIHAVTAQGFELKLALFLLACSLNFLPW